MAPYVRGTGGPLGTLDQRRVDRAIAVLRDSGQVRAGLTPAS